MTTESIVKERSELESELKTLSDRPQDSLDDCGLRFLLAMKHYSYLQRCLPLSQRNIIQKSGIGTSNIVWAFHSESQEELLNSIPSYGKPDLKWSNLKELGVGWWIKNLNLLRQCFERLAKSSYQAHQDPLDAALYYCALKKKTLVWGLFRSKRDEKMTAFFANDFTDERWRKAALKNAYALLGKQRFEHAVAFFLLANSLKDAVEVCLTKLNDIQLALCIARLFESNQSQISPTYQKLLQELVLFNEENMYGNDPNTYNTDPFLRSIGYWILKDFKQSLDTLLLANKNYFDAYDSISAKNEVNFSVSSVFYFYVYLRAHPFLVKQRKLNKENVETAESFADQLDFSFDYQSKIQNAAANDTKITPLERQLYFRTASDHLKAGCPTLALDVMRKLPCSFSDTEKENVEEGKMAQQLKFLACLKILIEELSTFTSGVQLEGSKLRYFLYIWLEKEIETIKMLCATCHTSLSSYKNEPHKEKETFGRQVEDYSKKIKWIKMNESYLRTLMNYCSLNCGGASNLAQTRVELMILFQELYKKSNTSVPNIDMLSCSGSFPLLDTFMSYNKAIFHGKQLKLAIVT